jgi:hypothetical protein
MELSPHYKYLQAICASKMVPGLPETPLQALESAIESAFERIDKEVQDLYTSREDKYWRSSVSHACSMIRDQGRTILSLLHDLD